MGTPRYQSCPSSPHPAILTFDSVEKRVTNCPSLSRYQADGTSRVPSFAKCSWESRRATLEGRWVRPVASYSVQCPDFSPRPQSWSAAPLHPTSGWEHHRGVACPAPPSRGSPKSRAQAGPRLMGSPAGVECESPFPAAPRATLLPSGPWRKAAPVQWAQSNGGSVGPAAGVFPMEG